MSKSLIRLLAFLLSLGILLDPARSAAVAFHASSPLHAVHAPAVVMDAQALTLAMGGAVFAVALVHPSPFIQVFHDYREWITMALSGASFIATGMVLSSGGPQKFIATNPGRPDPAVLEAMDAVIRSRFRDRNAWDLLVTRFGYRVYAIRQMKDVSRFIWQDSIPLLRWLRGHRMDQEQVELKMLKYRGAETLTLRGDESIVYILKELAGNIFKHGGSWGLLLVRQDEDHIELIARDLGPGIENIPLSMERGETRWRFWNFKFSRGLGLPYTRDLAIYQGRGSYTVMSRGRQVTYVEDQLPIVGPSAIGKGTLVRVLRALPPARLTVRQWVNLTDRDQALHVRLFERRQLRLLPVLLAFLLPLGLSPMAMAFPRLPPSLPVTAVTFSQDPRAPSVPAPAEIAASEARLRLYITPERFFQEGHDLPPAVQSVLKRAIEKYYRVWPESKTEGLVSTIVDRVNRDLEPLGYLCKAEQDGDRSTMNFYAWDRNRAESIVLSEGNLSQRVQVFPVRYVSGPRKLIGGFALNDKSRVYLVEEVISGQADIFRQMLSPTTDLRLLFGLDPTLVKSVLNEAYENKSDPQRVAIHRKEVRDHEVLHAWYDLLIREKRAREPGDRYALYSEFAAYLGTIVYAEYPYRDLLRHAQSLHLREQDNGTGGYFAPIADVIFRGLANALARRLPAGPDRDRAMRLVRQRGAVLTAQEASDFLASLRRNKVSNAELRSAARAVYVDGVGPLPARLSVGVSPARWTTPRGPAGLDRRPSALSRAA